jgi:hypothetical protein
MESKGIDTSKLDAAEDLGPHEMRFDYDEGFLLFREWMRELGEPEKLGTTKVRAVNHLVAEVESTLDRAHVTVAELIERHHRTGGTDQDFTSITRALLDYERSGNQLVAEVMDWSKPQGEANNDHDLH